MAETDAVSVMLADASTRSLTRDAIERTADEAPSLVASTDDRAEVVVGEGHRYDALRLIARTLKVSEDLIRPRQALNALRALEFEVDGVVTATR